VANESGRRSIDRLAEAPWGIGKQAHLELGLIVSFKDDTKSEDDQKREKEIPAECRAVSEKFTVSGIKMAHSRLNRIHAPDLFPQASPGQL
jgi:hypothetical protein